MEGRVRQYFPQDFCTLKTDTPNSSIIVKPAPNGWLEAIPNPPHLEKVQVKQLPPDPKDSYTLQMAFKMGAMMARKDWP